MTNYFRDYKIQITIEGNETFFDELIDVLAKKIRSIGKELSKHYEPGLTFFESNAYNLIEHYERFHLIADAIHDGFEKAAEESNK